jgi:predicted enzyme related to lactoylglutathione lyase
MTMTALASVMLGTTDPDRLHAWWTTVAPPETDDRVGDYRVLGYAGGVYLMIDPREDVQDTHPDPARTIINLGVEDARAFADRVDDLGGTWVAPLEERDGSLFATAQDPDGNYVQVIQMGDRDRAAMEGRDGALPGGLLASEAFSSFAVGDLDAARRFYGQTLGLDVRDEPMGLISVGLGGRRVMVYPKDDHVPATYTVLNLPVTDVEAAVRALGERGVEFLRYEGFDQDDLGIVRGEEGPQIAWFADPAGNILSVVARA